MKYSILILLAFLNSYSYAQLRDPAISFSAEPFASNRVMNFKSKTPKNYRDSINAADGWRQSLGFNVMFSYSTSKYSRIFFGLQFQDFGFVRTKNSLKFMDTIHPEIGIVNDLSQTGSNDVRFIYRYQYLVMPFMFSSKLRIKKLKSSTLHFNFGASVGALLRHDIKAKLVGFSAYGKKVHNLKDEGNDAALFTACLQSGFRLENPVYGDDILIFVQPELILPILKANYSKERAQLYTIGLQLGFMFKLDDDKAK